MHTYFWKTVTIECTQTSGKTVTIQHVQDYWTTFNNLTQQDKFLNNVSVHSNPKKTKLLNTCDDPMQWFREMSKMTQKRMNIQRAFEDCRRWNKEKIRTTEDLVTM